MQNISALLDVGLEVMEVTDGSVIYLPAYDLKSFFPFTRFSSCIEKNSKFCVAIEDALLGDLSLLLKA